LELTVGYCAVGVKRRSSWQLFSECGITCWGRRQSRCRDLWLRPTAWRGRTRSWELKWAADDDDEKSRTREQTSSYLSPLTGFSNSSLYIFLDFLQRCSLLELMAEKSTVGAFGHPLLFGRNLYTV